MAIQALISLPMSPSFVEWTVCVVFPNPQSCTPARIDEDLGCSSIQAGCEPFASPRRPDFVSSCSGEGADRPKFRIRGLE